MTTAAPRRTARQPELKGMPAKTKAQLRAEEYLISIGDVEIKKEAAEHRRLALMGQMKADKIERVVVMDPVSAEKRTFVLETLEKIKMKKGQA